MPAEERPRIEHRTPEDLVRDVLAGAVRIPWFQRGFQWEASDVVKLFDSVVRGFPIGDLLFWQRPAPAQRLGVGPVEVDAPRTDAALWVVDGQQRIASLVGALVSAQKATDTRFRVHLDLDTGEFHTIGPRDESPAQWVPVDTVADETALRAWLGDRNWLVDEQIARVDQAADAFRNYRIPVYLIESVEESAVREIFERINTGGRRLAQHEVFRALHDSTAQHRVTTVEQLSNVTVTMNFGGLSDTLAAACVQAYGDGDGSLDEVAMTLRSATDFVRGEVGIPHGQLLPDPGALVVLVRFISLHGTPTGRAAVLLRRWLWRSAVAMAKGDYRFAADPASIDGQGDPVDAASKLLGAVPSHPEFLPDLSWPAPPKPMSALRILGLAAQNPRDLATGRPVDVPLLMRRPDIFAFIDAGPGWRTFADVILHPPTSLTVRVALRDAPSEIAASHLVDDEGQRLLAAHDGAAFLARRTQAVIEAVRRHVAAMAEWGARDGRAVTDVIRSVA